MKKIFNFALYDFANSAFTTIIITFVFATYFAKQIAPNPVLGQSYWGWTIGITGFAVAIIGPIAGSFADKNKLPFPLLCDTDNSLRRAFGVPKVLGLLDGRVTYIVDSKGVIRHIFNDLLNGPAHVNEALRVLGEIRN